MVGVLSGFAVIAAVVLVGYLVGRSGVLGEGGGVVLARLTFHVATPALLVTTLADTDVRSVLSSGLLVTAASATSTALVYALVARLAFHRPTPDVVVGSLASSYVNAGNLGIPIAVYVLGSASAVAPALLFQLVVIAPVALTVLDRAQSAADGDASLLRTLTSPLRNPVSMSCLLGAVISLVGLELPELLLDPVRLLGGIAVPAALISFGMSLHGAVRPAGAEVRRELAVVTVLKTVVQPLVAYAVAHLVLGLDGLPLLAAVVLAALPTAQNVYVYSVRYSAGTVLARDSVLTTTAVSVPVLLGVAALLG